MLPVPNAARARQLPWVPLSYACRAEGQVDGRDCYEKCARAVSKGKKEAILYPHENLGTICRQQNLPSVCLENEDEIVLYLSAP